MQYLFKFLVNMTKKFPAPKRRREGLLRENGHQAMNSTEATSAKVPGRASIASQTGPL